MNVSFIYMRRLTQTVYFQIFLLLLGVLFILYAKDRRKDRERNEMRWEKAEKMVGTSVFTVEFKDSIRQVFNVTDGRRLRNAANKRLPFKREKLVYNGGWGFIKAGFGIFDMNFDEKQDLIFVEGKAVTNNFVSAFFKVRDYSQTIIDGQGLYPLFFEQHVRENRYRKDTWIMYHHPQGKLYTNRRGNKREYEVSPFTHDYLSLLYYLRTRDFAPGDTFSINCFVHGKDHPIFFRVWGLEEIKVDAGTFRCIKVQPRLVGESKRGFTRRDKMYLWLTDDPYHMMVKGKSKIAIGSISAELIHYEREE